MRSYLWHLLPQIPARCLGNTDLPPLLSQLLYNRGISESSQVAPFLAADSRLSSDPLLLPDMEAAVIRLLRALLGGENIAVYGDYDVDGISGTALLVQGLKALGGQVAPYIPHRMTEGYGLNTRAIEELHRQAVSLIITVDCGVSAIYEVERAKGLGLDVIVTDHHTPLSELPPALAIINPKRPDSGYPFSELSGAGIAYKLLQALFRGNSAQGKLEEMTDLVALGTIADIAPLVGENRYLVKEGLKLINTSPRPGIKELISQAGLELGNLDAEKVSFILAPRLNAAGRLAHAMNSFELLMTVSPEEARNLATWLGEKNAERQHLTTKVLNEAREQILSEGVAPLLMVSDSEYPVGVTGIAASRLVEEFYRPVILVSTGEVTSVGSCRSIPEFNIIAALNKCQRFLSRFGGHSQAAGFSLPTRNLPELKRLLTDMAAVEFAGKELLPHLDIDIELGFAKLAYGTFQMLQRLAPFGRGNPMPIFLSRKVKVVEWRTMGNQGEHLRLKLRQDGYVWDGVAFRQADSLTELPPYIDIVYNLEIDHWQGRENLRLNILDMSEAQ